MIQVSLPIVLVRSPVGRYYNLNEYEFIKLRTLIVRNKVVGWEWIDDWTAKSYKIRKNGKMDFEPPQLGLMDTLKEELFIATHLV